MNSIFHNEHYYKVLEMLLSYNSIQNFMLINKGKDYVARLGNKYININDFNENLELKLSEFNSNSWEILEPDDEMNDKLYKVRDKVEELNVDIDSRFYDLYKMDILDIFNQMYNQNYFSDDDLANLILSK